MRILLVVLYFLSLIPSPDFGTTLCISGNEPALEGIHLPGNGELCCTDCCALNDHHEHTSCIDIDLKPLAVKSSIDIPQTAVLPNNNFESIFASTPFRAPPVQFGKSHDLPSKIGLKLKSTAVILC